MIKIASGGVGGVDALHLQNVQHVLVIVHRAFARAELAAPAAIQGAFIPVGGTFTAFSALTKIFETATSSILIVDPHADGNLLSEYALSAPENVTVMVLADQATHKPGLKPAAQHWVNQYGQSRPLQIRLAPERTLHDREIIVDDRDVWSLGQSFNALAKRSSTSLGCVDADTAKLKISAYGQMWASATPP
ncbi:MAG: phosphatidylserine/phosphatidylglycerophosphate/cardiolipin synthase family protein [Rhodospirillales bacterium]|nr:phosphatidylserine/phosphatidylglycerophosphate/cardiolipin synthase family protein [Rhodospirillales bacterium]